MSDVITLESLIATRLRACLSPKIKVLQVMPISRKSLQPKPAVHVFPYKFQFGKHIGGNGCVTIQFQKKVHVVIVAESQRKLAGSEELVAEVESYLDPVISALTHWSPNTPPYISKLVWDTEEEIEAWYDESVGIIELPMVIMPEKGYSRTYKQCK